MRSTRFLLSLLTFFIFTNVAQVQMDTTYVEIWGMPKGYSELGYMQYLNQKKVTPCMVDLNKFGYKEGYALGIEKLRLLVLRRAPVYSFSPPVKKQKIYPPKKVIDLLYFGIDNDEVNFLKQNYIDFHYKDSAAVDKIVGLYKQAGVTVPKDKIYARFFDLKSLDSNDKDSCLRFLKLTAEPRMKSAALLGYMSQVKTKADMLALFPLLMDFTVGDEVNEYLMGYFSRNPLTATDWSKHHAMFVRILNCPEPYRVLRLMVMYQKDKHCKQYAKQILGEGNITILEILNSRRRELSELRATTASFLTYLTGEGYGQDYQAWVRYIGGVRRNSK
ncbi:hypothetical protein [Pedobacter ginsengisoli]|uniref:hypothetical protein n=1 Tax=Pedobacter ginsengisoli TaxID=363852 RepID=UPI0025514A65|nr:hypothetical protein [Pedobacter ginsengisoli]